MAISSPGVGSNLDVNSIVSQLMSVEQQPLTVLAKKEASYQAQLSAYGLVQGALSSLQSTAKTLATSTTFAGMSVAVSDSTALSASASSTASAGAYNISITQLAKNNIVRSNASYAALTDTFNVGTLDLTVGSKTTTVNISASNNTLDGIRQAINDAKAGVNAAIVNDGTTNRLVLTSDTTGSSGAITIVATDSGAGGTHALSDFSYAGVDTATMKVAQAADNAIFSVNNISITRPNNTITDAISGVTLNLSKANASSQITVSRNTNASQSAITAFVNAYNAAVKQLQSVSAYDAANKKASILTGDGTVRAIQSKLSTLVRSSLSGIAGAISSLSDIGIALQKDGTLSTDSTKLSAALNDPNKDVSSLFSSTVSDNKGIAVRFGEVLDNIVGTSGLIAGRTGGINASIKDLNKQQTNFQDRLVQIEKRYRAQFTALDTTISSMSKTSAFLTQQLSNLSKSG